MSKFTKLLIWGIANVIALTTNHIIQIDNEYMWLSQILIIGLFVFGLMIIDRTHEGL